MKHLYFMIIFVSLALQGSLTAQPQTPNLDNQRSPQLEIQVQKVPSYNGEKESQSYASPDSGKDEFNEKIERTLSILKPDALKNRHVGDIISRFEDAGLHVAAIKMTKLTLDQASQFYSIHRDRPFFSELVKFMSSGPIIVMVLEGNQAISKNRELMGATNPKQAKKGTIRADLAESVTQNVVHGSDSSESAKEEINFFFKHNEIYSIH